MTEAAPKIPDDPIPPGNDPPANSNDTPPAGDPPPPAAGDPPPSDPPAGDPPAEKPALPDNWRELGLEGAGFNKEQKDRAEKLISRYGSLGGVVKALLEKDDFIRTAKIKRDMPDPKDEKGMAEWRKEQGIPDKPDGYVIPEPIQKRLVDEDKPILADFTEFAHSKNAPAAFVEMATEWYVELQEKMAGDIAQRDEQAKEAADDVLRENWARDEYKPGLQLAKRFWEASGIEGLSEARLADGRKLGNIPEFIMWSSDQGRERFGDVVFSSGDAETKFNNRKAEIDKIRNTDFARYESEGLDKEYRQIIEKELARGKR